LTNKSLISYQLWE